MNVTKMAVAALLGLLSAEANAQFTQGNIVVYQIGDSTTTLGSGATRTSLLEYTTSGALVKRFPAPTTGSARITNSGTASTEGQITLSPDGLYITIPGYDVATGTASVKGVVGAKVLDTIGNAGVFGRAISITGNTYAGENIRSAVKGSGDNYWTNGDATTGSNAGVWYFNNNPTATLINNALTYRAVNIFNGTLYTNSSTTVYTLGSLPKVSSSGSTVINITGASFTAFSINAAGTVMYISDDVAGIRKITKSGSTWSQAYLVNTTGARGLTVDWSSANATTGVGAKIYFTTAALSAGTPSQIRLATDGGSAGSSTSSTLVTAPNINVVFRGITFAPSAQCTPAIAIQSNDADNSICAGTSVTFSIASSSNLGTPSYQWKLNGNNISGATNNSYTTATLNNNDKISLTVTSTAACAVNNASVTSTQITTTVNSNVTPTVSIQSNDADNSICQGTSVTFSVAASSNLGTTPTYQWKLNGNNIPGATNATYTTTTLADGNTIALSVTSNAPCAANNGTASSAGITVNVTPTVTPTIDISYPATICYLSQSTFTANGTSLGSAATYTWERDDNTVPNTNGNQYITSDISVYNPDTIIVTVSNINQACATTTTINDTVIVQAVGTPNPAVVASGSRIFCDGGSVILSNDINAANTDYTFVWTKDGSTVGGNYNYTATESGTYQLFITNPAGCVRNSAPQVVTEKPNPIVNAVANGPLAICSGSSVSLTTDSTAGYSIRWRRDDATNVSTASTYVAKTAGSYTARVTLNGCTVTSAPLNVTVKTTDVTVTANGNTTFCTGGSVTLNAANNTGYTYQWYNSTTPISNATDASYTATTSGSYKVAISNDGCPAKNSATTKVTVNPTPVATITQTAITTSSITLRGNNGTVYTYQWYLDGSSIPAATSQIYTATVNGVYTLEVTRGTCSDLSDPVTISTLSDPAMRTAAVAENAQITVYPNPSEGVFKIGSVEPVNVIVKDVQGRVVAEAKNAAHIDMSNQPAGMYIMMISDLKGNLLQVERVTKK